MQTEASVLSNHLGNVLTTISDRKTPNNSTIGAAVTYYKPVIVTANDYYPFGMLMPGRNYNDASNKDYRYGFNGKENDNDVKDIEGGQQDYGMRIYDPRLGRFLSVDPITKDYPELTPYQFASNTPLQSIDLDGLEGYNYNFTFNKDGSLRKITYHAISSTYNKTTARFSQQYSKSELLATGHYGEYTGDPFFTGVVIAGAIAFDIFVTKGWATRTLLASSVFGSFHHNKAKDEKQKQEWNNDAANNFVDLLVGWGVGKTINAFARGSSSALKRGANRFNTAYKFYKNNARNYDAIIGELRGIELSEKVFVTTYKKGTTLEQWRTFDEVTQSYRPSNYYTLPGTDPNTLGITLQGRKKFIVTLSEDTKFLQSTAADITDIWTVPGKSISVKGGGTQLYQTNVKSKIQINP